VTVRGSQVGAGSGGVVISGRETAIENQTDVYDSQSRQWSKQSGVTLSVGLSGAGSALGSAVSQGQALADQVKRAGEAKSDRASALYGIAAARSAYDLGQNLGGAVDELGGILGQGAGGVPDVGVSISLGYSKSESESRFQSHDQVSAGSAVISGGDTVIVARGEESREQSGDLNITGSTVTAGGTATLAAKNDLNLKSAEEVSSYQQSNKSSSSGVSVSYGISKSDFVQYALQFHSRRPLGFRGQMGVAFRHFQAAVPHEPADGV
jgi:filamentous hemagglutinin